MVSKKILLQNLAPYIGSYKVLKHQQDTSDIVKELILRHDLDAKDYDRIYKYFYTGNIIVTAKNIFNFIKQNIVYKIEPGSKQTLKTPGAFLITGVADCKQYSQFIGGLLDAIKRNENLKFDWCYRFSSYNDQKAIQHVFVVLKVNNTEIWIDPVLNEFNRKKEYTYKLDKKPKNTMALYSISGFKNDQVGKTVFGKLLDKGRQAVKSVAQGTAKVTTTVAKAVASGAVEIAKIGVKVATIPARNAFLLLVRLNVLQMAKKMGSKLSKIEPDLKKLWEKLGGNYNTLKETIIKGSRNQIGASINGLYNPNTIGAEPISSSAVALATPIIIAITKILKDVGIEPQELIDAGKDIAVDKIKSTIDEKFPPQLSDILKRSVDKNIPTKKIARSPANFKIPNMENPKGDDIQVETNTIIDAKKGTATMTATEAGTSYNKFLLPAGILAVYLLAKK